MKILFTILFLTSSFLVSPFCLQAEKVKKSLSNLEHLDAIVEGARKKWDVPGISVAVVKDGKIIHAKGYGYRDLATKKLVTPETVFQIGSISKSFTSTLAGIAVSQKKCSWNTPVKNIMPSFQMHSPWVTEHFTVEDLFAQKSGLPEKTGDMQALLDYSNQEIIYNLRFIPTEGFRARFSYQNVFYLLAGQMLEELTQQPLDQLLQEKLFNPLGMQNTICSFKRYLEREDRASFYALMDDHSLVHIPDQAPFLPKVDQYRAAGGIHSTATDIAKWLAFHMNEGKVGKRQLLSKKQLRKLHCPQVYMRHIGSNPSYYCLGWMYTEDAPKSFVWHTGETFGVKTAAAFIPEEKLGIVVLTNMRGTKAPEGIVRDFFDHHFGRENRNWVDHFYQKEKKALSSPQAKIAVPHSPELSEYVGTYQNQIYGEARIVQEKDRLILVLGPKKSHLILYPKGSDRFSVYWSCGGLKDNAIEFSRDQHGKVAEMSFDLFSEESSAQFQRTSQDHSTLFGYL